MPNMRAQSVQESPYLFLLPPAAGSKGAACTGLC